MTWNMQGATQNSENKYQELVKLMTDRFFSIACIQEAGDYPRSATPLVTDLPDWLTTSGSPPTEQWLYMSYLYGSQTRGQEYRILWMKTDPREGSSGQFNLAIVVRADVEIANFLLVDAIREVGGKRPLLGVALNSTEGPVSVFSVHANADIGGADSVGLLRNTDTLHPNGKRLVFGDYNVEPASDFPTDGLTGRLNGAAPALESPFDIWHPEYPTTRGGNLFDYAVALGDWAQPNAIENGTSNNLSDHDPVYLFDVNITIAP